jgi:hypothetical protein
VSNDAEPPTTDGARYMTPEEMAECERLTLEAHEKVRGALHGKRGQSKWRAQFDAALVADWQNGVSIGEFARRFGYKGNSGCQIVRYHAIKLGLLKP